MDKYVQKILELRNELRAMFVNKKDGEPFSPEFNEKGRELDKVWRNLQAYCRRHGCEFPRFLNYGW